MVRLGQNFLIRPELAEKIVAYFQPQSKIILEVGPGQGILTAFLLKHFPKEEIIAIELDKVLATELEMKFTASSLQIINADILQVDLQSLTKGRPVSIIANLPYYISRNFFDWMISMSNLISDVIVLVQKEFAEKLLLKNPNAQAIILNYLFRIKMLIGIGPANFHPRPKVESTLLKLEKKTNIDIFQRELFYAFIKLSFRQRRKTLGSNLKSLLKNNLPQKNPLLRRRAEELNPQEFYGLFSSLQFCLKQSDQR